jgi:hypothetical protein
MRLFVRDCASGCATVVARAGALFVVVAAVVGLWLLFLVAVVVVGVGLKV